MKVAAFIAIQWLTYAVLDVLGVLIYATAHLRLNPVFQLITHIAVGILTAYAMR